MRELHQIFFMRGVTALVTLNVTSVTSIRFAMRTLVPTGGKTFSITQMFCNRQPRGVCYRQVAHLAFPKSRCAVSGQAKTNERPENLIQAALFSDGEVSSTKSASLGLEKAMRRDHARGSVPLHKEKDTIVRSFVRNLALP